MRLCAKHSEVCALNIETDMLNSYIADVDVDVDCGKEHLHLTTDSHSERPSSVTTKEHRRVQRLG